MALTGALLWDAHCLENRVSSCVFEPRSIVHSLIRFCFVAAALAPLACLHAEPADDSLRIYAVDIWQDPPQSWGPGRGVYLGKGLVLTAAHVVGSAAHTKPRVHIAGMEAARNRH